MIKKLMLVFAIVLSFPGQALAAPRFVAKMGSAVVWSFKKMDRLQWWVFNTKTASSTARLVFLAALSLRYSGENNKSALESVVANPLGFLGTVLVGPSGIKRVVNVAATSVAWTDDDSLECQYYKKLSVAAWAVIFLTAWNNDRAEREAKKPAVEAKKSPVAEKIAVRAEIPATA